MGLGKTICTLYFKDYQEAAEFLMERNIDEHLRPVWKPCSPNHKEYGSFVRGLVFAVLTQPISTHCTIVGDVAL